MKRTNFSLMLVVAAAAMPQIGFADNLRPVAPIVAVTVFQGQAEVTRKLELDLTAGRHKLLIDNLPANLIAHSVRLAQPGGGGIDIGAIDLKRQYNRDVTRETVRRLQTEIESLTDRVREQDDVIKTRRLQLDFIAALGREIPKSLSAQGEGKKIPAVQDWRETWKMLASGTQDALNDTHKAERAKRELNKQIALAKKKLQQLGRGRAEYLSASISLSGGSAAKAVFLLSYQVPGASWRPVYDLRLDSESEQARLVQSAMVQQRTGEDWSNVELTLSTTQPGRGGALPSLNTWFVDLQLRLARGKSKKDAVSALQMLDKVAEVKAPQEKEEDFRRDGNLAQIVATEFAATYKVPALANLVSGSEQHRVPLVEKSIATKLSVRAVPKLQPYAYLYGEVEYKGEEPLLPGIVALHRDGTFVGRTSLPLLRPGQKIDLSFGIDDRVQVTRRLQTGERSDAGLFNSKKRHERRYLIEVANHHKRAIRISVLDHLPTPRDERIEVEMLKESTKPTETDFKKRKGVLAWGYEYAPGEKRTIHFGFALLHPDDARVRGF